MIVGIWQQLMVTIQKSGSAYEVETIPSPIEALYSLPPKVSVDRCCIGNARNCNARQLRYPAAGRALEFKGIKIGHLGQRGEGSEGRLINVLDAEIDTGCGCRSAINKRDEDSLDESLRISLDDFTRQKCTPEAIRFFFFFFFFFFSSAYAPGLRRDPDGDGVSGGRDLTWRTPRSAIRGQLASESTRGRTALVGEAARSRLIESGTTNWRLGAGDAGRTAVDRRHGAGGTCCSRGSGPTTTCATGSHCIDGRA